MTWTPNEYKLKRKIPKEVLKWESKGLRFDVKTEVGILYNQTNPVITFCGPLVIEAYRLSEPWDYQ